MIISLIWQLTACQKGLRRKSTYVWTGLFWNESDLFIYKETNSFHLQTQSQLPLIWVYHSHIWTVCRNWVQSGGQICGYSDMTRRHVVPCTGELPLIDICYTCQQGLKKSLFEFIYRVCWHSYEYITHINRMWLWISKASDRTFCISKIRNSQLPLTWLYNSNWWQLTVSQRSLGKSFFDFLPAG